MRCSPKQLQLLSTLRPIDLLWKLSHLSLEMSPKLPRQAQQWEAGVGCPSQGSAQSSLQDPPFCAELTFPWAFTPGLGLLQTLTRREARRGVGGVVREKEPQELSWHR